MTGSRLLKDTAGLWPPDDSPVLPCKQRLAPATARCVVPAGPRSCYYSATAPMHLVSSLSFVVGLISPLSSAAKSRWGGQTAR